MSLWPESTLLSFVSIENRLSDLSWMMFCCQIILPLDPGAPTIPLGPGAPACPGGPEKPCSPIVQE